MVLPCKKSLCLHFKLQNLYNLIELTEYLTLIRFAMHLNGNKQRFD